MVGFDEHFSYQKMATALQYLLDDSTHFIATNTDSRFPLVNGKVTPGRVCTIKFKPFMTNQSQAKIYTAVLMLSVIGVWFW